MTAHTKQKISLVLKAILISAGIIFTLTMGNAGIDINANKHEKMWDIAADVGITKFLIETCYTGIRYQIKDGVKEADLVAPKDCDDASKLMNTTRERLLNVRNNIAAYTVPEIDFAVVISTEATKMCLEGFPLNCVQLVSR